MTKDAVFFRSLAEVMEHEMRQWEPLGENDVTLYRVMEEAGKNGRPISYSAAGALVKRMETKGLLVFLGVRLSPAGRRVKAWRVANQRKPT